MIRLVRTPEGNVLIDRTGRANGRGAYVCRTPECVGKGLKTGSLARALKCELPQEVREALLGATEEGE